MRFRDIRWRIRYAMQFFPFTLNTVLCTLAAWGAWYLLYKPVPKGETPSMIVPFVVLMGKMVLWIFAGFILVSVLSAVVCWVHYLVVRRNHALKLSIEFTTESKVGRKNKLYLNATLEKALRPLLGFVNGRIVYDDNQMTDIFGLLSHRKKDRTNSRSAITGRSRIILPDIKEYDVKGGFIYFHDMLRLFSLAVAQPISGHFYQPPVLMDNVEADVFPKKTQNMDVRIEQMRRVEGEQFNYKDFESGDDVRRIVWKVYARSRELVVRVPEMFEPYASHLYYYASFYAPVGKSWLGEDYLAEMLNYYKNSVWTVYDALLKKEWKMAFVPDQSFNIPELSDEGEKAARTIANSNWHNDKSLGEYFNPKVGSVLCVSSLTDPTELSELLERCDASTVIYFVRVSRVMRHFAPLDWFARVLFLPPQDRLARLRTRWTFSPLRIKIHRREKEIAKILSKSSVTWGEL